MKFKIAFAFLVLAISCLSFLNIPKGNAQTIYTTTFYPDLSTRNGFIYINSTTYPPSSSTLYKSFLGSYYIGNSYYASPLQYRIDRAFISFNTSTLPDSQVNFNSANLYLSIQEDRSQMDFNLIIYSGQNQYTNSSTCTWNKCPNYESMLSTVNIQCEKYYSYSINVGSISTTGLTQFRLINSKEGTTPTSESALLLFDWNDTNWKPYLQVKWSYAYESKLQSLDILNMDYAVSDALGLNSPFLGGLLLSFALILGFIILPLACLKAPIMAYVVLLFGAFGIFIVLGWLNVWFVFMEVFLISVMLANVFTRIFVGRK